MEPTVFVIDDSPTTCKILEVLLKRAGYEVQTFLDPVTALSTAQMSEPLLFIVDILLPKIDGYTVMQHIRRHPESKNIPIIAISGQEGGLRRLKARLAGANAFLVKPLLRHHVLEQVAELVKHQ